MIAGASGGRFSNSSIVDRASRIPSACGRQGERMQDRTRRQGYVLDADLVTRVAELLDAVLHGLLRFGPIQHGQALDIR